MYFWFATVVPLLRAVDGIVFVVHTKRQLVEDATGIAGLTQQDLARRTLIGEDSLTRPSAHIQTTIGLFMAIYLFGLHGLRVVLWPKGLEGELPRHDIGHRSNGCQWMPDIDSTAGNGRYAFFIFSIMMMVHLLFLVSVAGYNI